jgi:formylglycine-generating enzyme required for sulfatase activity
MGNQRISGWYRVHASSVNVQTQGRRGPRSLSTRWLLGGGVVSGMVLGLSGFLFLEHPGWIGLWVALFVGLGWAGWDVRLRQVGVLPPACRGHSIPARPVKDGPFEMVALTGGSFLMGTAEGDAWADQNDWSQGSERPQHRVTLGGYRIGRTPVTRGQWRDVMGQEERSRGDDELPVTNVSWFEAVELCNALSRRAGRRPARGRRPWPAPR